MIGKYIHTYQITQRLGEGGMGVVYKASDTVLGREVALKMLHAQLIRQSQFLDRFKKEARVLAQLLHPNIAVIYNFIEQDDNHFMVMEYVQGKNLDELLKQQQTLTFEKVIAIFLQALEGLQHAHKKGIFHRDIKPSNFILSPDGTVKLMDFGIAKIAGEQRLTQVNRVVGTVEFMAPELIEGKDPSVASDIYAAGVTMYELLTGKLPFQGNTDFNLMQEILKTKPVSLDKLNASIPKALSAIVMKSLEKKPENRFEDARAFRNALVQAFPNCKDIDLSQLLSTPTYSPATQFADLSASMQYGAKPTALVDSPATIIQQTSSTGNKVQEFIEKRKWILAAVFLLLAISVGAIIRNIKDSPSNEELVKNDSGSTKKINPVNHVEENSNAGGNSANEANNNNGLNPDPNKKVQVILPEDNNSSEKKTEDKKTDKTKTRKVDETNVVIPEEPKKEPERKEIVPVQEPEKKYEPVESKERYKPNKRSKNSVTIEDRLRIEMRLRDNVSESSIQQGQSLSFVVNDPVKYSGHVIIADGAIANGYVKSVKGNKAYVVINSVRSVDGQTIEFQERDANFGGNLFKGRNCWAITKKGYTISY